ncbi:MAG: hypothetical protein ACXWLL_12070 [Myxococcaceae bacterium]
MVIDADHRPDVSLAVRVRWTRTWEVEVTYDQRARVFLAREEVGDVAVRHVRVMLPPPSTERGR